LSFTSHAQDEACGTSNITLNGIELPQQWNGDFATGSGSYTGATDLQQNERSLQRHLDLEWNSTCLHGDQETDQAAQVLTVSIKAIDGKTIITPSGFTVSFRQQTSPPSLLRFESTVSNDIGQSWREPPTHLRLVFTNDTVATGGADSTDSSLEADLIELRILQAELQKLQEAIANKKEHINSLLNKDVKSLKEEINDCEGLACIVKAVAHKAHGALKVALVHFRPNRDHSSEDMGRPDLDSYAQAHGHASQKSGGSIKTEAFVTTISNATTPPSYGKIPNDLPPRPTKPSPYIIALEVTLSLLCCGCLVAVIRHKCSSLRTRTERAAAREERDTARAYRRAARQHAWRNWWRGNWRKDRERIEDYEEKRSLIQEQEGVLEDAMQAEIRQLRAAHDVVNDLVRDAEEGRVINHAPCNCHHPRAPVSYASYSPSLASTYPPTSIPSRPLSRTDSLPSYRSNPSSEPPNYESEVDMSQVVANGFRQYRSSNAASETTSHWTPESSVVDVSPRPSAETLRYPQSIFTSEDESDGD
jgi:hypothetical protein